MPSVILYPKDSGSVEILYPFLECGLTVEEIAMKDVPASKPYMIIDGADLPADRTFVDAWVADFSSPDGYGIGQEEWFRTHGVEQL